MTKTITADICKEYNVEALPNDNGPGFVGAFSIPGKDRQLARNDDGSIAVLDTEDEAVAAAGEDLCEALNARTRNSMDTLGYRVMGGAELAVTLAEIGISPHSFSILTGTTQERILEAIDGERPITRPMNLIAHLLTLPGVLDEAERYTRDILFDKRELKRGPPARDNPRLPPKVVARGGK